MAAERTELEERYYALLAKMTHAPRRDLYLLEAESELLWAEMGWTDEESA